MHDIWFIKIVTLEKEMATHSSTLAWKIPWMEEPGRLQSMGSQRVGHNLATKQQKQAAKNAAKSNLYSVFHFPYNGRRTWQPTPVFLPGKFHGWRSLVGYSPWGRKELDTTE